MPAPITSDQFLELISKSGLLDPQRFHAYFQRRVAVPFETPGTLADAFVRDGQLTRFQADQLLQGKWRNFILSGKYKILGPLGSGGMGHVFLCEHQIMRRRVAVKVLPQSATDRESLQRFHREARAVAQLKHTNIVGGYDVDRDGNRHFLVMEYIDGGTFRMIVKQCAPLTPLRAAHYIRQTALGLQHAHEAGLVHRDIKPANLLLDRTGTVKILDLGLARFFHDEADDLSKRHIDSPVGTMDYMAPEQALNSHLADIRADIYSLGVTFYFLLAGHGPFREGNALQKLIRHQLVPPQPIRDIRPDVPEGLAEVIMRMMAKEPSARYQTPAEVAEALVPWTQTPIPPPPPEEMPALVPPGRGTTDAAPGSGLLPAFLYETASTAPPGLSQGVKTARTPLSATPPQPVRIETEAQDVAVDRTADTIQKAPKSPTAVAQEPRRLARTVPSSGKTGGSPPLGRTAFPRGWIWPIVAAAAVLLLGAGITGIVLLSSNRGDVSPSSSGQPGNPTPTAPEASRRLRLLVPAYFYPDGEGLEHWKTLLKAPDPAAVVIVVNTDSGPGKVADPNYVKIVGKALQRGFTVLGYVSTRYGKRPLQETKEDIARWIHFYPGVRGIFFDEQASSPDDIKYYAELYEHVKKVWGLSLVINNPGTTCAEEYLAQPTADVVCLIESTKDINDFHPPLWMSHYKAARFAGAFPKIDDPVRMKRYIRELVAKGVGYCFITDGTDPNPWGRLPSYWEAEVEAVQQVNAK